MPDLNQLGFVTCMVLASAAWATAGYMFCQSRHDNGGGDVAAPPELPSAPDFVPPEWTRTRV